MIEQGIQEKNDIYKNLLNGYKLQVIYMKNKKQYTSGLEVCNKILKMDELEIGTIVDKLYMLNEKRLNKEVLEMTTDILKKFPHNKNVLYQQGVAAMFLEDYELGEQCFEQVVEMSPSNISAFKNLFVCYKRNNKQFEKLKTLRSLTKLNSFVSNHVNEEIKCFKELILNGEYTKKLDIIEITSLYDISESEEVNNWIVNELDSIITKDDPIEEISPILYDYCQNLIEDNLIETKFRMIRKFKNKQIFSQYIDNYKKLDKIYAKKKKQIKNIKTR